MQVLILILQIVFIVLGILGFFYIKNLLPSYFSEKGKNLATKEDIGEITEKIKSVETKIKIKESGKIDYETLKRRTILDFFSALTNWQNAVVDATSDISDDNVSKNSLIIQKITEIKQLYNLKQGEVDVFIDDIEFYKLKTDLALSILTLQNDFEKHCHNIEGVFIFEQDVKSRWDKIMQEKEEYGRIMLDKFGNDIIPKRNDLIKYLSEVIKNSFE